MKMTPHLIFKYDKGYENERQINDLLREISSRPDGGSQPDQESSAGMKYVNPIALFVNEPVDVTSYDCIRVLKRAWKRTDIGHGGTLDRFASELLRHAMLLA